MVKLQTFTGKKGFPLDMLRSDTCWPMQMRDVEEIRASLMPENDAITLDYIVTVATSRPNFNIARWESFGWKPTQ
jgi:hypothetical protein